MQKQLKITFHDPNTVDVKSFKFKGIKALRNKFRRAERIITIDDPENPEDPIHFRLRALTLKEENQLAEGLLSQDGMRALVAELLEKTKDGAELQADDVTDLIADQVSGDNDDVTNDRFLRKIQMGIIAPKVSLQWLAGLNPVVLEVLHDTIDDLRAEQEHWITENAIEKSEAEKEED